MVAAITWEMLALFVSDKPKRSRKERFVIGSDMTYFRAGC
jgi:hypothetical protein